MSKVYAVGIGPGGEEFFTQEAKAALERADVIAGYTVYVDLVRDMFPGK
jgi:precorrin-3B C17-methyltransferase